jgi:hypothetical protein
VTTCNATTKDRGRLRICELELRHTEDHRDGEYTWAQPSIGAGSGDRVFEA